MTFTNNVSSTIATLLIASVALGGPPQGQGLEVPAPPAGGLVQIGGFTIDMSNVREQPAAEFPQNPLLLSDLTIGSIRGRLLQTTETFQLVETVAGRQFLESSSWYLERDAAEGLVFALRKERDDVTPEEQNEIALKIASRHRLAHLGILRDEIRLTLQRRLMRRSEVEGQALPPEIHRYKTFVMRGLNGVEVEGHRAVITYHEDGSFQRAWLKWPALAPDGHRLKSDLAGEALAMQAFIRLIEAGEVEGDVKLRFKYMPTLLPDGSVRLELVLGARLAAEEQEGYTEEAREINVGIGAY